MAENLVYIYHHNIGVSACNIRIFNSFGPGMQESDNRILPRIASAIVGNHPIPIFFDSRLPTRTYCASSNTIAGMFLALINGKSGETYNIGVDNPELTVPDLVKRIESVCGVEVPLMFVKPKSVYLTEPMRRCPSIAKANQHLGYTPRISLDAGLDLFFSWALTTYSGLRPLN
jgi:nucleoside-diphosphate-sugar epimerase